MNGHPPPSDASWPASLPSGRKGDDPRAGRRLLEWLDVVVWTALGALVLLGSDPAYDSVATTALGVMFLVTAVLGCLANLVRLAGYSRAVAEYVMAGGIAVEGIVLLLVVQESSDMSGKYLGLGAAAVGLFRIAVQYGKGRGHDA